MISIIIPHRDRQEHLRCCLKSIDHAFQNSEELDVQVLVVDNGSGCIAIYEGDYSFDLTFLYNEEPMPIFNKSRLLNIGIESSYGKILTFLDADAIVGPRFFESYKTLDDKSVTLLCHRVRYLENIPKPFDSMMIDSLFKHYEDFRLAYEGRQHPSNDARGHDDITPVFGNSQCSLRRSTLGDLRFNEDYVGAGYEDLWFLRELWRKYDLSYQGVMPTDPMQSMLHIYSRNSDTTGWREPTIMQANRDRYFSS